MFTADIDAFYANFKYFFKEKRYYSLNENLIFSADIDSFTRHLEFNALIPVTRMHYIYNLLEVCYPRSGMFTIKININYK